MNEQTLIYIVDDDPAVRDALTLLLEQEGLAVGAYACAPDFLAALRPEQPGCAIVDLRMPGMDGMQLQEELAQRAILLPIIFLTGHGDIQTSVRAIKAGAVDFLTKPVTGAALVGSVHAALKEGEKLHAQAQVNQNATSRLASLTEREYEVMRLAIEGLPNKEIARRLDISHRTVEIHKARIMHKTAAATLLDLARIAEAGGRRNATEQPHCGAYGLARIQESAAIRYLGDE